MVSVNEDISPQSSVFFCIFVFGLIEFDVKKILILLAFASLLGGQAAYAQPEWNAGMGYAAISFNGTDCSSFLSSHALNGFYAGVSHEFYFSALAGLTFEPAVLFCYQSGRNGNNVKPKYIKMHYLSVPMDVKYTFELSPSMMASFFAGPVLNVGVAGNLYNKNTFVTTKDETDLMHPLTRVNLQWNVGSAVTIAQAIQLRVSYAMGVSRLIPEQEIHVNTFSVGAGFLF